MKSLKIAILLALAAVLLAPLSSASALSHIARVPTAAQPTTAAAAAAGSGCSARVASITKPGSYVRLRAVVACNRVVDEIRIKAFITRGEGNIYSDFVTCKNSSGCTAIVDHPDKSGTQHYWGGAKEGGTPPATVVWDNGSTWFCGNGMDCTMASHDF